MKVLGSLITHNPHFLRDSLCGEWQTDPNCGLWPFIYCKGLPWVQLPLLHLMNYLALQKLYVVGCYLHAYLAHIMAVDIAER